MLKKGDEYVEITVIRYPLVNLTRRGHGCFKVEQVGRLTRRYPAMQEAPVRWGEMLLVK